MMSGAWLYILSFLMLLVAETTAIMRDFCVIHGKRLGAAILNSFGVALWCGKIIVVIDEPLTILTSALGGFAGVYLAFYIDKKINKK